MAALGLDGVMDRRNTLYLDRTESARAFRDDRGRYHQRVRAVLFVAALCAYGLVRVWLSTEISSQESRITRLRVRNEILATDLTVTESQVAERRMYGALLVPAERAGFASAVNRRTLRVEAPRTAPAPGMWSQLGDEVRRGSQLVLTEAFAQGRRDGRARNNGARP
jgi:hypothetical protein